MSFLNEPGDLARTPLAAILLEALNVRVTGVLRVEHGGGASRLYFRGGAPVGAQVFGAFKPLGHILLQRGLIDIDALSTSLAKMAQTRRPQGELLVELGAASQQDVDLALTEQQEEYFAAIADLPAGAYAFETGAEIPAWARGTLLSPLRTIVDALERPQAQALVGAALQLAAGGVRLASGYAALSDDFRWTIGEEALVAPLARPTSLEDFFAGSEVSPERAQAIVAALLLLNLAVPVAEQPRVRGDTAASLFLDLACGVDARGTAEEAAAPVPAAAPPPASAPSITPVRPTPDPSARRSDPEEARARRQRLLHRAMSNMGIGPLAGRPRPPGRAAGIGLGSPAKPSEAEETLRHAFLAVSPPARAADLFARLDIAPDASRDQVRNAYLQLAKGFHPDRFAAPAFADLHDQVRDFFTAVNEAYEVLSDDRRRQAYVAERKGGSSPATDAARLDFQKGEVCLRSREWARARGFYEAAVRADPKPDHLAALAWVLVVDSARRDLPRAKALLEQALREPACARARYVSGLVAREHGDEGDAERWFREAVRLDPRFGDAQRELRVSEARRSKLRD
jgi:tetratricopeptide (TPR) repeat protein